MMVRYCPMWLPVNSSNFLAPGPLNWKVTMGWPVLTWPPSNPARASPRSAPVTMTSFFRGTVFFSGPGSVTPVPAASQVVPCGSDWLPVLANSSSAVCPMIRSARWGSSIPGSSPMMRRSPSRWIVGSTTPSWSMRLRMTSIAASTASAVTFSSFVSCASRTMWLAPRGALPAAPLLHNNCGIYTGTCSWADPSFVSEFYPEAVRTKPRPRLRYYASVFPTVQVDASYHALQPADRALQWAETVPAPFVFNIKAFAWLTWHDSIPARLPREVFVLLPKPLQAIESLSPMRLPEEILTAVWDYFAAFVDALRLRERLGYVLFQFPKGQGYTPELFNYLDTWALHLENWPVAGEVRPRAWFAGTARGML